MVSYYVFVNYSQILHYVVNFLPVHKLLLSMQLFLQLKMNDGLRVLSIKKNNKNKNTVWFFYGKIMYLLKYLDALSVNYLLLLLTSCAYSTVICIYGQILFRLKSFRLKLMSALCMLIKVDFAIFNYFI